MMFLNVFQFLKIINLHSRFSNVKNRSLQIIFKKLNIFYFKQIVIHIQYQQQIFSVNIFTYKQITHKKKHSEHIDK